VGRPGGEDRGRPSRRLRRPTEVFAGDRVVRDGAGNLRVISPAHFRLLYRFGDTQSGT
jgi:hypothetical protein